MPFTSLAAGLSRKQMMPACVALSTHMFTTHTLMLLAQGGILQRM